MGHFSLGGIMDISLSLGIDTKVDAINSVLDAIGSVGINSEEEIEWNIDAASADKLIDKISQQVQTNSGKGFWFNKEMFHKFSPDPVSGKISVPNNTLSCLAKRQRGQKLQLALRGGTLFDPLEHGYDMRELVDSSGYLPCILVVNLPFEYLPSTAKQAITDVSRFWFVNDKEGDQIKMDSLNRAMQNSLQEVVAEDARQKRRNILTNGRVAHDVMKAGGYNNV